MIGDTLYLEMLIKLLLSSTQCPNPVIQHLQPLRDKEVPSQQYLWEALLTALREYEKVQRLELQDPERTISLWNLKIVSEWRKSQLKLLLLSSLGFLSSWFSYFHLNSIVAIAPYLNGIFRTLCLSKCFVLPAILKKLSTWIALQYKTKLLSFPCTLVKELEY